MDLKSLGMTVARAGVCAALVAGCASPEPALSPPPSSAGPSTSEWHAVPLLGKKVTRYSHTTHEGRRAIHAMADNSASMWRRRVNVPPEQLGSVRLSWWVDRLMAKAHVGDADHEDAVARVLFAFEGDRDRLSPRTRAAFDLVQLLTGEAPPYATLMYVWDTHAEVGSVIINPRSDRVRKIVLDSGPSGLRSWRDHQRHLADDFRKAFGEEPGRLVGIAVMTDGDNTQSVAQAWYGAIELGR